MCNSQIIHQKQSCKSFNHVNPDMANATLRYQTIKMCNSQIIHQKQSCKSFNHVNPDMANATLRYQTIKICEIILLLN